jgi:hypothetical protein
MRLSGLAVVMLDRILFVEYPSDSV